MVECSKKTVLEEAKRLLEEGYSPGEAEEKLLEKYSDVWWCQLLVKRVIAKLGRSRSKKTIEKPEGPSGYPEHAQPYTVAELLFIGLYEEDPVNAHEIMYNMLEPVLLSSDIPVKTKRALFFPIKAFPDLEIGIDTTWNLIKKHLAIAFNNHSSEEKERICRVLRRTVSLAVPVGEDVTLQVDDLCEKLGVK